MKKPYRILPCILISALALSGCKTTSQHQGAKVVTNRDNQVRDLGVDYLDIDTAASQMVGNMLQDPRLGLSPSNPQIIVVSTVVNNTTTRFYTTQLTNKIVAQLTQSGRAFATTVIGATTDNMTVDLQELRNSGIFDPATLPQGGKAVAPKYSLSGEIFENRVNYGKKKQQRTHNFQLRLTDLQTGIAVWQDETEITKQDKL